MPIENADCLVTFQLISHTQKISKYLQVDGGDNDLLIGDDLEVEIISEKKKKRKQGKSNEEEEVVNHRTPRIFKIFQ